MRSNVLGQMDEMSNGLSNQELLWLIDQFIHRLKAGFAESKKLDFKSQLAAMAKDSEIQAELKKINHEFASVESDGLEG